MTTESASSADGDDDIRTERALVAGLVSAVADSDGPLDQSAIDQALGVASSPGDPGLDGSSPPR